MKELQSTPPFKPDRLLTVEVLRRLPLLADLPEASLAELIPQFFIKRFGIGECVIRKGTIADSLLFVLTGRLQVVDYTEEGKEIGLNLIGQGAFLGELSLIDGRPRSADVMALAPSVIVYLPRSNALKLIYGNPTIAEKMFVNFAEKIRVLSQYRTLLALPNAHQRVYALLCKVKKPLLTGQNQTEVIENLPTQQQIAIMVNTSRETVSRAISELIHKGILQKNNRLIIVRQPRKLETLAKEKPSD